MDGDANLDQLVFSKFAVGQPVPRNEDPILLQGDSDELIAGGGTGGSKSLMASGTAIV